MNDEAKIERRRSGALSNLVGVMFAIILAGLSWWMSKIDAKADKVPVLEERLTNLQASMTKIEAGVSTLLSRK